MTKEEAIISLSFHSGRNSDISDPRWINGFLGSLRKFNKDIVESNFIDVVECLKTISEVFQKDKIDREVMTDIYGILYQTTIWLKDGGMLSDIDDEMKSKIKYWMEMYSYAIMVLLGCLEGFYEEAFHEFDSYLGELPIWSEGNHLQQQ